MTQHSDEISVRLALCREAVGTTNFQQGFINLCALVETIDETEKVSLARAIVSFIGDEEIEKDSLLEEICMAAGELDHNPSHTIYNWKRLCELVGEARASIFPQT